MAGSLFRTKSIDQLLEAAHAPDVGAQSPDVVARSAHGASSGKQQRKTSSVAGSTPTAIARIRSAISASSGSSASTPALTSTT